MQEFGLEEVVEMWSVPVGLCFPQSGLGSQAMKGAREIPVLEFKSTKYNELFRFLLSISGWEWLN